MLSQGDLSLVINPNDLKAGDVIGFWGNSWISAALSTLVPTGFRLGNQSCWDLGSRGGRPIVVVREYDPGGMPCEIIGCVL